MPDASQLNRKPLEWLANTFKQVDWLVPAFISLGFLNAFAARINAAPTNEEKLDVVRQTLSQVYDGEYLAVMLLERYSRIAHVCEFRAQIDEAFKAYFSGLQRVAVTAMIPVLEGIMRKIALSQSRDVGSGTKGLLLEFDALIEREENSPNCYGERMVMLESLRDFIKSRLLESTKSYSGHNEFNRHGILHGIFGDYGDRLNFFRAITILDLICFSIGLMIGGVSAFAPEDTAESRKLADHYRRLAALSKTWTDKAP